MLLVFVHGWSVTHTNTYGGLPEVLTARAAGAGLEIEVGHVYLGRYVSFENVTDLDDVARAFDHALRQEIPDGDGIRKFSCITHSTGGPVVRNWVENFYGAERLDELPLEHLVMLAPANHGSALAQLGKSRLSRITTFFSGVEPGERILDWLELGSPEQLRLNQAWMDYESSQNGFYPFVLTGQTIDSKLYDHLNSYTGEKGSDGAVRVAAANMNYRRVRLRQSDEALRRRPLTLRMEAEEIVRSPRLPIGVIPGAAHAGRRMGIMRCVTEQSAGEKVLVDWTLRCLQVTSAASYTALADELDQLTLEVQAEEKVPRCTMVVFRIHDDQGRQVDDYDLLLLASGRYSPDLLPSGFFVDRQRNQRASGNLTYFLDYERMSQVKALGFRLTARPNKGFSYFVAAEFRSEEIDLSELLVANETVMVDMEIRRFVDENVFRLAPATEKRRRFRSEKPSGSTVL